MHNAASPPLLFTNMATLDDLLTQACSDQYAVDLLGENTHALQVRVNHLSTLLHMIEADRAAGLRPAATLREQLKDPGTPIVAERLRALSAAETARTKIAVSQGTDDFMSRNGIWCDLKGDLLSTIAWLHREIEGGTSALDKDRECLKTAEDKLAKTKAEIEAARGGARARLA